MTKIITFIALLICSYLSAQTSYETEMKNGFLLWQSKKNTEASAVFEKIASEEKDKWLPNYYVVLANTLLDFENDKASRNLKNKF